MNLSDRELVRESGLPLSWSQRLRLFFTGKLVPNSALGIEFLNSEARLKLVEEMHDALPEERKKRADGLLRGELFYTSTRLNLEDLDPVTAQALD